MSWAPNPQQSRAITNTSLAQALSSKAGNTLTARINGQQVTVQVARDLTVSAGDTIVVAKVGAQWFVIQRVFSANPAEVVNPVLPNPKPDMTYGTFIVAPVETRSYRSTGWRTDTSDVIQGSYGGQGLHTGCAFYGSKPLALAGATVLSATLRARRLPGGTFAAQAATLRLVTESTRPAGAPTLTSSASGPALRANGETDLFTVTTSWVQEMVDGTAGGLAVYVAGGSPYLRFAGKTAWSAAWTLTINWRRG